MKYSYALHRLLISEFSNYHIGINLRTALFHHQLFNRPLSYPNQINTPAEATGGQVEFIAGYLLLQHGAANGIGKLQGAAYHVIAYADGGVVVGRVWVKVYIGQTAAQNQHPGCAIAKKVGGSVGYYRAIKIEVDRRRVADLCAPWQVVLKLNFILHVATAGAIAGAAIGQVDVGKIEYHIISKNLCQVFGAVS